MNQAKNELFSTNSKNEFVPNGSTMSLSRGQYALAGQLFGSSVCQGGPSPSFMAPWVYKHMLYGLEGCALPSFVENSLEGYHSKNEDLFKLVCH